MGWVEIDLMVFECVAQVESGRGRGRKNLTLLVLMEHKMVEDTRQGKAKARQGKARQGKARQGKARQGKATTIAYLLLAYTTCNKIVGSYRLELELVKKKNNQLILRLETTFQATETNTSRFRIFVLVDFLALGFAVATLWLMYRGLQEHRQSSKTEMLFEDDIPF
eukprot:gene5103-144_t